jgi:hypothetical protein
MIIYTTLQSLAAEAITRYHADPARVERALAICERGGFNIGCPRWDENGMPVQQSDRDLPDLVIVRSSGGRGWYFVRPRAKTCSCRDSQQHNICKHRIAVWIWYELIKRTHETISIRAKNLSAPPAAS